MYFSKAVVPPLASPRTKVMERRSARTSWSSAAKELQLRVEDDTVYMDVNLSRYNLYYSRTYRTSDTFQKCLPIWSSVPFVRV